MTAQDIEVDGENQNQIEGVVDIDTILSLVVELVSPIIIEEKDQKNLTTEEMDINPQSELQNPSTNKNYTHQDGLGETQPQEQLNEEDYE
jgi:hypothetical protein